MYDKPMTNYDIYFSNIYCKNVMLMIGESDLQTMKSNLRAYLEEFKKLDIATLEVITEYSMPLAHRKYNSHA